MGGPWPSQVGPRVSRCGTTGAQGGLSRLWGVTLFPFTADPLCQTRAPRLEPGGPSPRRRDTERAGLWSNCPVGFSSSPPAAAGLGRPLEGVGAGWAEGRGASSPVPASSELGLVPRLGPGGPA